MSQVIQFTGARAARMPDMPDEHSMGQDEPRISEGYCRVVNALAEGLASHPITSIQQRVLWAVIRMTYGWNKGKDRIAASQLAELTKLRRQQCSTALNELIDCGVILRDGGSRSAIKINTKVYEWKFHEKATKGLIAERVNRKHDLCSVNSNCGHSTNRNCGHTKDNRQTTNNSSSEKNHGREESEHPVPVSKPEPKPKPKTPAVASRPNAAIQNKSGSQWGELVDLKLAEGMARAIDRLLERPEPPNRNLTSWANTIRLMRERDLIEPREIRDVFVWANQDGFWKANILSPEKLREKFPQLLIRKKIESEGGSHETGRRGGRPGESELDRQLTDFEYARNNF